MEIFQKDLRIISQLAQKYMLQEAEVLDIYERTVQDHFCCVFGPDIRVHYDESEGRVLCLKPSGDQLNTRFAKELHKPFGGNEGQPSLLEKIEERETWK